MRALITLFVLSLSACSTAPAVVGVDAGPATGDALVVDAGVPDSGLLEDAPPAPVDAPVADGGMPDAPSAPDAWEPTPDAGLAMPDAGVDATVLPTAPVSAPSSITTARCALDDVGALWCWDATGALTGYGGVFVRARGSCAQRADTAVACTTPSGLVELGLLAGELLEFSTASSGCTNDGTDLHCWGGGRTCTWTGGGDVDILLDPTPRDWCALGGRAELWGWPSYPDRHAVRMGWTWRATAGELYAYACRTYTQDGIPTGTITNCLGPSGMTFQLTISGGPREAELVVTHGAHCEVIGVEVVCRRPNIGTLYRIPGTVVGIVDNPLASDRAEVCVWDGGLTCYSLDYAGGVVTTALYTVEW